MRTILAFLLTFTSMAAYGDSKSVCFGTTDNGRLENGWQLPSSGQNFEAYSLVGVGAGRNYVHSAVHEIIIEAYKNLLKTTPDKHFVYGETGWEDGGKFRPHKTHQNGLSVEWHLIKLNARGAVA